MMTYSSKPQQRDYDSCDIRAAAQLVSEIALRVRQSLDLDTMLQTVVDEVRQFLGTDRVVILRFHPDWTATVDMESVGSEWIAIRSKTIYDPCFAERYIEPFRSGLVTAKPDVQATGLTECHLELLTRFQVRANLVVPILQQDHLWGLLIAHHCSEPRHWQTVEVDLLKQLATHISIAIQQAELHQQLRIELEERKAAEQTMREQAALLDICQDAIAVHDLEHRILFWNQGAARLYGWTATEAIGKPITDLMCKVADPVPLEAIHTALLEQGEWNGELHQITQDGRNLLVESHWTLIRDEAGNPKSILVVNTDITEKKQLEAQFLRAQRLESLGTLASGIAHDLNNVLTPILAIAQLLPLKFPNADPMQQQLFQILEDNTKRGANLIKQVLSFARGMEGKRTLVQVNHLLSEIRQVSEQTLPKSIQISLDLEPNLWLVNADTTQLHQVLMNLVVNARDAMPAGGVLQLSAENITIDEHYAQMNLDAKVGRFVAITVADSGIGITPEVLSHVFEPFFTTKAVGEGTGLGLSTVIGIVKSHGGFVNLYSELGRGTQFKVFIPALSGTDRTPTERTTLPTGHGELILVVDDEAQIRAVSQTTLEAYGYRAITAADGIDAIAIYAQHQAEIQAVIIDMMMPEMDGITAIQTLRRINPDLKIIAVSGLGMNNQRLRDVGITDFLMKPYTAQDLLVLLSQQLRSKNSSGQ